MKKLIEIHLGHVGVTSVDANTDIYVELCETSPFYNCSSLFTDYLRLCAEHSANDETFRMLGMPEITDGENIAELFREYFDSDSIKTSSNDTVEDLEIFAYAKCGEFDALAEHPVVKDLCDCVNGALSELCDKVGKITGKDMSYYEELTEIEPALFDYMHPQTAVNIIREQYLTYAEILIAICKEAESEKEEWL